MAYTKSVSNHAHYLPICALPHLNEHVFGRERQPALFFFFSVLFQEALFST